MKGEQLVLVDPSSFARRGFESLIEDFNKGAGHKVVASIPSAGDIDAVVRANIKPTVAVIGDGIPQSQGPLTAQRLKDRFPGIVIVALSIDGEVEWADHTLDVLTPAAKMVRFFTELEH